MESERSFGLSYPWYFRGLHEIHFNSRIYLTHQTNINFPLFSGLSVFFWTNSDIARLIRSEWLIWYLSHRVVISFLRTSGNLRQVWCGCFFIDISFRHFGFWRPFDWRSLECVSLLIYWIEVSSSDPIRVWVLVPVGHSSWDILLFSSLYRSI